VYARPAVTASAAILGVTALMLPASAPASVGAGTAVGSAGPGGYARGAVEPSRRLGAPLVIAHRGASAYAPENTLAAVGLAADLGIGWVENDVQRTKDGELVVIHDTSLRRTTDAEEVFPGRAPWNVRDFTAAEIAGLDAGSWFGARWAGTRVPTFSTYLRAVEANRQNLLLEIKEPELYPGIEQDILRVLRQEGWLDPVHVRSKLVVQSFSADSVRAVHRLRPDLTTGFLGTPRAADLASYAAFTDQVNPDVTTLSGEFVAAAHRLKGPHGKRLQVVTWTVDDVAGAARADAYGVDGIITNRPDLVRDAVGADAAVEKGSAEAGAARSRS
jgi:glycerophosphoryl diester phosphodiesterase